MARPRKPAIDLSNVVATTDGKWRVDVVRSLPNGQRFRRTTKRADQAEAIEFRDEALAELERVKAGEAVIATSGYTVAEWGVHCLDNIMPTKPCGAASLGRPRPSKSTGASTATTSRRRSGPCA